MKTISCLPLAILLTVAAGLTSVIKSADARTWTSNDGKTLEADFLGVKGDTVLVNRDGKAVTIPLERLSEADRKWVAEQSEAKISPGEKPDDAEVDRISALLEKSLKSSDLSDEERDEVASFVARLLPAKGGAGEPVEWEVDFPKWGGDTKRTSVLLSADMFPEGTRERDERLMWFHIIFFGKEREIGGDQKVGRHPASGMDDRHLFVTAKRTSVRGVADAESYQDNERIRAVMEGIDLDTIAKF
ncbi:MAG TPA: SHD1 domain-containing protein [Verrucomicrobiales bacterium]|nr:SHD1 domain-containing protein [Verrucomicrobiales bacterium]